MRCHLAVLALASLAIASCAGSKVPAGTPLEISDDQLFLEPVPAMTGWLDYEGRGREYSGPVRIEGTAEPLALKLEDYDEAELFEVRVISEDPVAFGRGPGGAWIDVGSMERGKGDEVHFDIQRAWQGEGEATMALTVDFSPATNKPPPEWVQPGTRLFYGIAYDEKPITKIVPMGVQVTLVETAEGGWAWTWRGDLDEGSRTDVKGRTWQGGERTVPPEIAERGSRHFDRFEDNADPAEVADATGLFIARSASRNLETYGGAAFEDKDVGKPGVLEKVGEREVIVPVDGDLWSIPATVAAVHRGEGIYVVAQDPKAPLILSATRPGWSMKLMAVATPRGGGR